MAMRGAFPDERTMADVTAKMLVEVGAVNFNAKDPFILTSGWASPVYLDCRRLISFPRVRETLMEFGVSKILKNAGFEQFDAVAGGETAGIPFAAWIAERMMLPMQYVRKKPKGFGRNAQIEGVIEEGQRILLVEDMTTDGRSKVKFLQRLTRSRRQRRPYLRHLLLRYFPRRPRHFERRSSQHAPPRNLVGCLEGCERRGALRQRNAYRG